MADPTAKRAWVAVAISNFRQAHRSSVTALCTLGALCAFVLLVALPLPIGDRTATLLDAAASCQWLLVVLLALHAALVSRGPSGPIPLGAGLDAMGALCGRWAVVALALAALTTAQHIVLHWFVSDYLFFWLARLFLHGLASAFVILAWAGFLGRRFGPLPAALLLLVLFLCASAWADATGRLPSLAFFPDLALLSPVGHGLRGPPIPALLGYSALQALFPLALTAVFAQIDAARGRRQRA